MTTGPKKVQGRGGARPNGKGRIADRFLGVSGEVKRAVLDAMARGEQEHGVALADILVGMAYGDIEAKTPRVAAVKLALDYAYATPLEEKAGGHAEPAVFLPEEKPDPARTADVVKLVK